MQPLLLTQPLTPLPTLRPRLVTPLMQPPVRPMMPLLRPVKPPRIPLVMLLLLLKTLQPTPKLRWKNNSARH